MKKLWSRNAGGKILFSVIVAVCVTISIAILTVLWGWFSDGFIDSVNKKDNLRMDKYEQFIENSNSAWKSIDGQMEEQGIVLTNINKRMDEKDVKDAEQDEKIDEVYSIIAEIETN